MDERDFFKRVIRDHLIDRDQVEQYAVGREAPMPGKAWRLTAQVLLSAAGLALVLAVTIPLVRQEGMVPAEPESSESGLSSGAASSDAGASSGESAMPVEMTRDENGFWILPDSRVTPLTYKGPAIPVILRGDSDSAVLEKIEVDLAAFGIEEKVIIPTVRFGDKRYPYCEEGESFGERLCNSNTALFRVTEQYMNCNALFSYDVESGTVRRLSSYQVDGYNASRLDELAQADDVPTDFWWLEWIAWPKLSEDSSFVAYQSNRRTYEDFIRRYRENGEKEGLSIGRYLRNDIWYIDLGTGEESLLVEDATAIVWAGHTLIYSQDTDDTLWKIDVDTKKIESFTPGNQTVSWPEAIDRQGRFLVGKRPVVDDIVELAIWDSRTDTLTEWNPGPEISGLMQYRDWTFLDDSGTAMALYRIDLNVPHETEQEKRFFIVVTDGKGGQTVYTLPYTVLKEADSVGIAEVISETQLIISYSRTSKQEFQYAVVDLSHSD